MTNAPERLTDDERELQRLLSSQSWRLSNLYSIIDKHGSKIRFVPNWAQARFYNNKHGFDVILKARQLGMSTFILIYALDCCLFTDNFSAGIIAHTREDSENLFKNKVKFAYDNLPVWLKEARGATQDSARRMEFNNNSSITVGTSLRGGTNQLLHVSEYGKIAARYPEKAREIKTGALNTVHEGQEIFIESTAEGNSGEFYEVCQRAMRLQQEGYVSKLAYEKTLALPKTKTLITEKPKLLTSLDPKLHFFPWFMDDSYQLEGDVSIDVEMQRYFEKLPIDLLPKQKAWYVKKGEQQGGDMKREFPSTPKEAFEQSMEGAIYANEMRLVRERGGIGYFPHEVGKQVYTYWDLGKGSDYTAIWFMQKVGNEWRVVDYHESWNEGWEFYAALLKNKGYVYGEHVLPWDGEMKVAGKEMTTVKQMLWELGVQPIRCVNKTGSVWNDLKTFCKPVLPNIRFNKDTTVPLIKALDNYRKEWDDRLGQWKDKPRHDDASHGCDAGRTFFVGHKNAPTELALLGHSGKTEFAEMDSDPFDY